MVSPSSPVLTSRGLTRHTSSLPKTTSHRTATSVPVLATITIQGSTTSLQSLLRIGSSVHKLPHSACVREERWTATERWVGGWGRGAQVAGSYAWRSVGAGASDDWYVCHVYQDIYWEHLRCLQVNQYIEFSESFSPSFLRPFFWGGGSRKPPTAAAPFAPPLFAAPPLSDAAGGPLIRVVH